MSVVNVETGEIVETLSSEDARRLTDRIRLLASSVADSLDKMAALIDAARIGSAWMALNYRSWTEYVSTEFAAVLPRLDRDPRQEFVRELSSRGMSTRAIAPLVRVSHETVAQDIAAPVRNLTPQTPSVVDGGEAVATEGDASASEGHGEAPVVPTQEDPNPRSPIVGIDGKTYAAPAPKQPKPVLDGNAAEYDNAAQGSLALARAVTKLLQFQHPTMRAAMRRNWSMASPEVPPTPRRDVTPEQMRVAAHGLLALADEWETP